MKPARRKYYRRLCLSLMLMALAALVAWLMAGDAMRWELCFVIWCVVSIILFFSVGPGMTLGRIYGIEEAHKKRIAREYYESWKRVNRKFLKKLDREIDREIDNRDKYSPWRWNGLRGQYERHNYYKGRTESRNSKYGADCGDGSGYC